MSDDRCALPKRAASLFSISFLLLATSSAVANGPMCTPPRIDRASSLLVLDTAVDKSKFAFRKTMDAILGSMEFPVRKTQRNRENFLRTLLNSFNDPVRINGLSKLPMHVDLRPFEATLIRRSYSIQGIQWALSLLRW